MKIVNPIYDIAFKYLMENNKLAKKVLSVILDKEIVELQLNQQETFIRDSIKGLKMFRMDFKATIKESDGSRKTVLIELQKSKNPVDIIRFRNYLASNYKSGWDAHDSEEAEAKHLEELADERQKSAKALKQKEKALKENKALNMKLAKAMKKLGASCKEIKAETGLKPEDIE